MVNMQFSKIFCDTGKEMSLGEKYLEALYVIKQNCIIWSLDWAYRRLSYLGFS